MAQADVWSTPGRVLEQAALLGVGRQRLVEVPVEVVHASAEGVVFAQQVGEQDAIRLAQFQAQGVAERVELAADMRACGRHAHSCALMRTHAH